MELKYSDNVVDSINKDETKYNIKDSVVATAIEQLSTKVNGFANLSIEGNTLVIEDSSSNGGGGNFVNGYEFVDLGLSVDWCTCNIGATKPEEYGWYFQWGGTTAYNSDCTPVEGEDAFDFSWSNYKYCNGSNYNINKYCNDSNYGIVDNKTILELEDDAAYIHIGSECRMPTIAEYLELTRVCNSEFIENYKNSEINGILFTLKSDPTKTLFFPASGSLDGTSCGNVGSYGYYWSSSLSGTPQSADCFSTPIYNTHNFRYRGLNIRGVKPKQIKEDIGTWENIFEYEGNNWNLSTFQGKVNYRYIGPTDYTKIANINVGDKIRAYYDDEFLGEGYTNEGTQGIKVNFNLENMNSSNPIKFGINSVYTYMNTNIIYVFIESDDTNSHKIKIEKLIK